ncbi:unnamed protein product [Moneuplotes crassus]|uniref:Protein PBN1 n=1 Tax=Euplotes crassus TaxID=5936 RepID=A0AAD1X9S9_EUPCR|nr:unnamed protein product [Moneuplotes crassus]
MKFLYSLVFTILLVFEARSEGPGDFKIRICPSMNYQVHEGEPSTLLNISLATHSPRLHLDHQKYGFLAKYPMEAMNEGKALVNVKSYNLDNGNSQIYVSMCSKDRHSVNSLLTANQGFSFEDPKIFQRMGSTEDKTRFCKKASFETNKSGELQRLFEKDFKFPFQLLSQVEISEGLEIDEYTYIIGKESSAQLVGYSVNLDKSKFAKEAIVTIKKDSWLYFCDGTPHSTYLNMDKNLYEPRILSFNRSIENPGFHKIYQNSLTLKPIMSHDCVLKISEYVSSDIFFDMDELLRLKELSMEFDYPIDIEKPANVSKHHFVSYYLKLEESEGLVSKITQNENGGYDFSWWFPWHLRYQLPDKKTKVLKDQTTFWVRDPDFAYICYNDPRITANNPLGFEEVVNGKLGHKKIWRHMDFSSEHNHHYNVTAPVVPNKEYLMINDTEIITYEALSGAIVLGCMLLIAIISRTKSE